MATGATAALPMSSPPAPVMDHSDSNMSSPLSEVEDKDAEPEDMDIDKAGETNEDHSDGTSGDESNLSELNDSEAETERLYVTPKNEHRQQKDIESADGKQYNDVSPSVKRSPSKLQQVSRPGSDNDDDSLSDPEDDEVFAGASDEEKLQEKQLESADDAKAQMAGGLAKEPARHSSSESRKRKRSQVGEQSDSDGPLRKRALSITHRDGPAPQAEQTPAHEDAASTKTQSAANSAVDANGEPIKADDVVESVEDPTAGDGQSKKPKRNGTKGGKNVKNGGRGGAEEDSHKAGVTNGVAAADEDGIHHDEEDHMDVEGDEEAEAAAKNEEELEKKRIAFDQLKHIEENFTLFRERLYEERLRQLEEEEAMLRSDSPTHPEYLAMMQCVDARRDERLRAVKVEYELKMETLKRSAIAKRAQAFSQFFQDVRRSREKLLESLGEQWYQVQHDRRRAVNTVPDYAIRLPATKAQKVRAAVQYNKEVSLLSGIAKNVGFPAAPNMRSASAAEIEEDFEAFHRARQATQSSAVLQPVQQFQEYSAIPFGRNLGPAGQEFLEQTPWANPNHPSHQLQRQHSAPISPLTGLTGPSRRHSHQPNGRNDDTPSLKVKALGDSSKNEVLAGVAS